MSFADAALSTLSECTVPEYTANEAKAAFGITDNNNIFPLLPKMEAHRYNDVRTKPFVTRGHTNYDTVQGYLVGEQWWKIAVFKRAARVVIVRSECPGERPWIFVDGILPINHPATVTERMRVITLAPRRTINIGYTPAANERENLFLLQGTLAQLKAHAEKVVVTGVLGGPPGNDRLLEATGIPRGADWQNHLLGAPLEEVQLWTHAAKRATMKFKEKASSYYDRFRTVGKLRNTKDGQIKYVYMMGYDVRVVLSDAVTNAFKRLMTSAPDIGSVFADVAPRSVLPATDGEVPADDVAEDASLKCGSGESPMIALTTTAQSVPEKFWDEVAKKIGARVLHAATNRCTFAVPTGKLPELSDVRLGNVAILRAARAYQL